MAAEIKEGDRLIIVLDKQEIVNMIGLLAAQLGNVPLQGNASGAVPSVSVMDRGVPLYRLMFILES